MGSCAESTKPLHSTGLSPVNLLVLAGSDRLWTFLSQKCAVGGVNVFFFWNYTRIFACDYISHINMLCCAVRVWKRLIHEVMYSVTKHTPRPHLLHSLCTVSQFKAIMRLQ